MAKDVVMQLIEANRRANTINARILAKYNAERPHDPARLTQEGLGWKQNFTTKPLPMMIEKVAPRFVEAIQGLKYLTSATLSDRWENSTVKSEKFRKIITDTIRGRKGWRTLVEDIAFDNSLFGHTVVAWLDEFTWFPHQFKMDENFVHDGCKEMASKAQVIALKEVYLPHELFEMIEDSDSAKTAGWNLEETRDEINKASPAQMRERLMEGGTIEAWYQNANRELSLGTSYAYAPSVVVVYTLLAREVTGKVSHYRVAGDSMKVIFEKKDRFESMESCLTFFAFQKGNGTLRGSKGVGRDIYELAGMLDRARNEAVDRAILSGKTIVQGDPKRIHTFKMAVVGSTVIFPSGWQILEQKIDGNIEPFLKMDAYFSMLVDQLVGSTSPPAQLLQGERKSPDLINLFAAREEEARDVRVSRFLEQFTDLVATMQRRICDPETVDKDAKAAQEKLSAIMTREEINELANQPVAGTIRDLTPQQRQVVVSVATEKRGNPLYNQRQLEVEDLTARVGADFADRVLLVENDPTQQAEQQRLQQLELSLLSSGQPVPVSPRDGHMIHLMVMMPAAEKLAEAVMGGQADTAAFEAMVAHITEHYNQALQTGVPKEQLKDVGEFVKKAGPALAQLKEMDAQAQQLAAESQAHDAEGPAEMGPAPV